MSGGSAPTVSGAAKSSDQPALAGRHHPDCAEGLCPALPVAAGRTSGDQSPSWAGVPAVKELCNGSRVSALIKVFFSTFYYQ